MPVVSVPASNDGSFEVTYTFAAGTAFSIASDIAGTLTQAAAANSFNVTTVSGAGVIPIAPVFPGAIEELYVTGSDDGEATVPAGYDCVVNGATGPTTLIATPGTTLISGSGGGTYTDTGRGAVNIAIAGGANDITAGGTSGTILGGSGSDTINGLGSNELIVLQGTDIASVTGSNDTIVAGPAHTTITAGTGGTEFLIDEQFAGPGANAVITDFNSNDRIVFVNYTSAEVNQAFADAQTQSGSTFVTLPDAETITFENVASPEAITPFVTVQCFLKGTGIRTPDGDIPVEHLRCGDRVASLCAGVAPIVWIGHRHVDCRRHPNPRTVWPVRIAAGAFGEGMPLRTLYLSPDHAVFVDDVLIPVRNLLNGATILQVPMDAATYYHIELPMHDVVLAEGLAAESYLDTGNRAAFDNGGGATMLHPDFALAVWASRGCAPLALSGPPLVRARRRLLARARALGHRRTRDPALRVMAGDIMLAVAAHGRLRRVDIPAGANDIRLASRTWVPAHARADDGDARTLGVALSRLWLDGRAASLESPALSVGWNAAEPGLRWTGGDAQIALHGARRLDFEVAMTGRYWLPPGAGRTADLAFVAAASGT